MGIKDKVLGILFDDEEEIKKNINNAFPSHNKIDNHSSNVSNTAPVFFDETRSTKRHLSHIKKNIEDRQSTVNNEKTNSYSLTDNISPIFGPIAKKVKSKPKYSTKTKKYQETRATNENKIASNGFLSDVVLSPIFGPMPTKQKSKTQKNQRKSQEQFDLDINDTGGFDIDIDNTDSFETQFDTQELEDTADTTELIGDTDRLEKISDHINQIKNEAASIYKPDYVEDDEVVDDEVEDDVQIIEEPEPEQPHNSISDLIHNFQLKEDYNTLQVNNNQSNLQQSHATQDNDYVEISNNEFVSSSDNEDTMQVIEDLQSEDTNTTGELSSVDDIFEDDDVDESKDLFSELFGDD